MQFGYELIREHGVPIQDFKIHPFNRNKKLKHRNTKKYQLKEKQRQKFVDEAVVDFETR